MEGVQAGIRVALPILLHFARSAEDWKQITRSSRIQTRPAISECPARLTDRQGSILRQDANNQWELLSTRCKSRGDVVEPESWRSYGSRQAPNRPAPEPSFARKI